MSVWDMLDQPRKAKKKYSTPATTERSYVVHIKGKPGEPDTELHYDPGLQKLVDYGSTSGAGPSSCTPTKIAEMYKSLYDKEWTNAFLELQAYGNMYDLDAMADLLHVLKFSYDYCGVMSNQTEFQKTSTSTLDLLKRGAGEWFVNNRRGDRRLWVKFIGAGARKPCTDYFERCIELCWKLFCNHPSVYIQEDWNRNDLDFTNEYNVYQVKGKKIKFVVWPVLYLHRGGPVLSKGVADGVVPPEKQCMCGVLCK